MARRRWGWLGVFLLAACGGGASPKSPAPPPSAPPTGPAIGAHTLSVHVAGQGTVSSADGTFKCTNDCSTALDGKITLAATPAPGWQLQGFSGACSGTACVLDGSTDASVTATFISPAPTRVTLTVTVNGAGKVQSSPEGIACPGSCSAEFAQGTNVVLTATGSGQSTFSGWSGACSGDSDCRLTLNANSSVKASFAAPPDECAGIVPSSLGPSYSGSIATDGGPKRYCDRATTDGQGIVAGDEYGMGPTVWVLYTPTGDLNGRLTNAAVPMPNGFQSLDPYQGSVITWSEQAHVVHTTALGAPPAYPSVVYSDTEIFPAVTGGSVVVRSDCYVPHENQTTVTVWRIDANGEVLGKTELQDEDCPAGIEAIADAKNRTLLSADDATGDQRTMARWFDSTGVALTDWFEWKPGQANPVGITTGFQPLIGGGVEWGGFVFPSGEARSEVGPPFLAGENAVAVVRGGKAYAVFPAGTGDTVQLFAPSGKSCGEVKLPSTGFLYIGLDGTVLQRGADTSSSCQVTWWPALLH